MWAEQPVPDTIDLFPVRQIVDTRCGPFAYLETGAPEMPLVLCLHGFPDHPMAFEGIAGSLAEAGYRAVAPWMRGYSPSTTDGPFHSDQLVDDVIALADHLAPGQRVAIVGHDWGSVVAYAAAPRLGDRLACAITLAIPHPLALWSNLRAEPGQLMRSRHMALFQLPRLSDRVVWANDFHYIDELWKRWSPDFTLPAAYRARLKACLAASMPAPLGYYRALLSLRTIRAMRRASKDTIDQPFLALHGERDGSIGPELRVGQERYFGGPFESEVLPMMGHFLPLEGGPAIAERILSWLRRYWPRDQKATRSSRTAAPEHS